MNVLSGWAVEREREVQTRSAWDGCLIDGRKQSRPEDDERGQQKGHLLAERESWEVQLDGVGRGKTDRIGRRKDHLASIEMLGLGTLNPGLHYHSVGANISLQKCILGYEIRVGEPIWCHAHFMKVLLIVLWVKCKWCVWECQVRTHTHTHLGDKQ